MSRQDAAPTIPNRPTNLAKLRTDILRLAAPNQRGVGSEVHTGPWPGSLHHHAIRGRGSSLARQASRLLPTARNAGSQKVIMARFGVATFAQTSSVWLRVFHLDIMADAGTCRSRINWANHVGAADPWERRPAAI